MTIKTIIWAQFFVLIVLNLLQCSWSYEVLPLAKIDVFYPQGFEVSIPDLKGITLFGFHAKLNEEMHGLEAGTWAADIVKPKDGRWVFRDRITPLQIGDALYYWTNVIYNGVAFHEDDGLYVVQEYANINNTKMELEILPTLAGNDECVTASTSVNGAPVHCSGQLLFEDDFDGYFLDSKWSVERRFAQEPDNEFNIYLNDIDDVLQVSNGMVTIKPKATIEQFNNNNKLMKPFSLGSMCTAKLDSECEFYPSQSQIVPPYISAQFSTKNTFSFIYGQVEVKAKMPASMWVYPQLWLEPNKHKYGHEQYRSGQMRIAQTIVNGDNVELQAGLILNSDEPWRSLKLCQETSSENLTHEFHVYQLTWTPNAIAFAVDNQEYCRFEKSNDRDAFQNLEISQQFLPNRKLLKTGSEWAPFDEEFYLTVGYGIGGHGDFPDTFQWQQNKPWLNTDPRAMKHFWKETKNNQDWLNNGDLKIDYIKVYAV